MDQIDHLGAATECIVPLRCVPFTHECDIKVEIPATPLEPPDRSASGLSAFMNADKNEPDGSFPERTKCTKPRRPRPSAAGKRVSPRPAWLTERPAVRVRKDLAAFFEFFTPLHFCVARPAQLVAPARLRKCVRIRINPSSPSIRAPPDPGRDSALHQPDKRKERHLDVVRQHEDPLAKYSAVTRNS